MPQHTLSISGGWGASCGPAAACSPAPRCESDLSPAHPSTPFPRCPRCGGQGAPAPRVAARCEPGFLLPFFPLQFSLFLPRATPRSGLAMVWTIPSQPQISIGRRPQSTPSVLPLKFALPGVPRVGKMKPVFSNGVYLWALAPPPPPPILWPWAST